MKRDERGAALAFAMVLVLLASVLGLALGNLVTSGLSFSNRADADRQAAYAADGAADWAIQEVVQASNGPGTPSCWAGSVSLDPQVPPMTVEVPPGSTYPNCTFIVLNGATTYVRAEVAFSGGHAAVLSWIERPNA
jgi:hypothetical protein